MVSFLMAIPLPPLGVLVPQTHPHGLVHCLTDATCASSLPQGPSQPISQGTVWSIHGLFKSLFSLVVF